MLRLVGEQLVVDLNIDSFAQETQFQGTFFLSVGFAHFI
jgi:hypothetical protein